MIALVQALNKIESRRSHTAVQLGHAHAGWRAQIERTGIVGRAAQVMAVIRRPDSPAATCLPSSNKLALLSLTAMAAVQPPAGRDLVEGGANVVCIINGHW